MTSGTRDWTRLTVSAVTGVLQSSQSRPSGTVLAFDFGTRRVGVAVGELAIGIAHPLQTLRASSERAQLSAIAELIKEWSPSLLVVGLPSHMNGDEHQLSDRCRHFALKLQGRFGLDVRLIDERLSSRAAAQSLTASGVRVRDQSEMLDQVAAMHILETYFSTRDESA
jgi:putative holliday junction resolvase